MRWIERVIARADVVFLALSVALSVGAFSMIPGEFFELSYTSDCDVPTPQALEDAAAGFYNGPFLPMAIGASVLGFIGALVSAISSMKRRADQESSEPREKEWLPVVVAIAVLVFSCVLTYVGRSEPFLLMFLQALGIMMMLSVVAIPVALVCYLFRKRLSIPASGWCVPSTYYVALGVMLIPATIAMYAVPKETFMICG